jgi:MoxR-like ATPase
MQGRDFVTPDDIKKVVSPVLRHRIIVTPEREMEGFTADKVIQQIIEPYVNHEWIWTCSGHE